MQRRLEFLIKLLEDLASEDSPIIVEGRKDASALRKLGIELPVICIKDAINLHRIIEDVTAKRVIVLTDFDEKGSKLAEQAVAYLGSYGIKADISYWRKISTLVRRSVKDIEGLYSFVERQLRIKPRRSKLRKGRRASRNSRF